MIALPPRATIWIAVKFSATWLGMGVVLALVGYAMLAWPIP